MPNVLRVHSRDNVLVALADLEAGTLVDSGTGQVKLKQAIPAKHKIAVTDILPGERLYMYGISVAVATEPIPSGGLVTTANVRHATDDYRINTPEQIAWDAPDVSTWKSRTFMGYHRSDGRVGTANYWLVLPLVFCENRNVEALQDAFNDLFNPSGGFYYRRLLREVSRQHREGKDTGELLAIEVSDEEYAPVDNSPFPNIDGVKFLTHAMGCGGTRDDAHTLCGLLAGYITHPNVAGATVLSLGCQNAQIGLLKREIALRAPTYDRPLISWSSNRLVPRKRCCRKPLNGPIPD